MQYFLYVLVGLLVCIGVGSSVAYFLKEPYNSGFIEYPFITGLHVSFGGIYLLLAPFQFIEGIRSRWLNYHRFIGRVLVIVGIIVGTTALFIALVIPFSGWIESLVNGLFAVFFFLALIWSLIQIRRGNVVLHREWMIRAFAIGLAIATMRVIFIPTLIIIGNPTNDQAASFSIMAFTLAFVIHVLLAEIWIRNTR